MKYAGIAIFVALLFVLAWKLVDKNHKSDKNYLNWHSSTFDISSDKAKVKAVKEASESRVDESTDTSKDTK
jgi:hypothetical protein